MRKIVLMLAVLSLAAVGIAACGGDDDDGDGNGAAATDEPTATTEEPADDSGDASSGGAVALAADPGGAIAYDTDSLSATGTNVQIALTNEASRAHSVRVEDADGNDLGGTEIFAGGTETADLELDPGEYTFFCSVPGHREAGMEGTLTVE